MVGNILVINVDLRETRVALIENGIIAELQLERHAHRGTVGNIVLGKVTRVLPGMQAAFIDVGQERAAFLHVEDLIRPDDFEAYLAADARSDEQSLRGGARKRTGPLNDDDDEEEEDDDEVEDDAVDGEDDDGEDDDAEEDTATTDDDANGGEDDDGDTGDVEDSEDDGNDDLVAAAADTSNSDSDSPTDMPVALAAAAEDETASDSDESEASDSDAPLLDDKNSEDDAESASRTSASNGAGSGASRRRSEGSGRGRRRRRGKRDRRQESGGRAEKTSARRHRSKRRGKETSRVSRSVPITDVVKEGDEVIVQISKEPIGTKGARVTSHVSLPGRYVVYLPTVDHIGISKRIGSARERARLRKSIDTIKPPKGGLIVRTVAEGLTKKKLKADIGYLINLWAEVSKKKEKGKAPAELYSDLDLVLKVARDLFTDEIARVVIDDREQYGRLVRFVEMFLPDRVGDVELYSGDEPIFDAYGIEDEIARALSRKVPLPSGGSLIVDQAEALTAIDVNTGRYVGKGSRDLEETALKTNLEAVEEIAYQLRFRNIGGLVILDLIDMEKPSNRERVWRALEQSLAKDKAKTTINRISDLGLIEMTRKRTRESLGRMMHEPCFYCDGTGQIQSRETIAYEILRQIRRERSSLPGYSVVVNAHPAIVDFLKGEEKATLQEASSRFMRRIELHARSEYHIEQYDLQGK